MSNYVRILLNIVYLSFFRISLLILLSLSLSFPIRYEIFFRKSREDELCSCEIDFIIVSILSRLFYDFFLATDVNTKLFLADRLPWLEDFFELEKLEVYFLGVSINFTLLLSYFVAIGFIKRSVNP